jgi:hypothetical protein
MSLTGTERLLNLVLAEIPRVDLIMSVGRPDELLQRPTIVGNRFLREALRHERRFRPARGEVRV